jgi:competence protein ComEC
MGASSLRAILMGCVVLVGRWISRPALLINSLGAAALISMAENTNAVFQIGFQLSFGLVLGIALLGRPVAKVIANMVTPDELVPRPLWKDWQWQRIRIWKPVAVGVAAGLGSWISVLPWSVLLMHQITPISMLVNLMVVPIAFVNLALGFVSLLCAPLVGLEQHVGAGSVVFRGVVARLNAGNGWMVDKLLCVVKCASEVSYGNFWIGDPFRRRPDFVVFDVSDGGAVLLNAGRESWLLDCGSVIFAKSVVIPAIHGYGVGGLAGLIVSHGDVAHIGGVNFLENRTRIQSVLHSCLKERSPLWRKFEQERAIHGMPVISVVAGDVLSTGDGSLLEVLYPPAGLRVALADDKCLVLRWRTKFGSVLYTADSGFMAERWLLENRRSSLQSDVWVRGVHESDISGTDDFVNAVQPRLVVVSDSKRRFSSTNIDDWVRRWRDVGLRVWFQRECGAVEAFLEEGGLRCVGLLRENCLLPLKSSN